MLKIAYVKYKWNLECLTEMTSFSNDEVEGMIKCMKIHCIRKMLHTLTLHVNKH